jgi:hypothetical protein
MLTLYWSHMAYLFSIIYGEWPCLDGVRPETEPDLERRYSAGTQHAERCNRGIYELIEGRDIRFERSMSLTLESITRVC